MPVIRQSTTLYAGTDIIDDNSTRTVYFNIPEGGNNPARYFKVARIKINANYQNVSLNGYFTTTNSALHVGFERKVEFDFIAYAATNPGAPQVTYLKRGPDTTNVLVYAVPDGGGAGTTYYDVYIKNGWYNDTNGELAIRVGYSSAVTVWQAGLDSGTSAPVDTLVNPNSNYAFDTAGNVGVGTTNPTVKLHVVGNGLLTNTSAIDLRIDASSLGNASLTIDRQTTAAESKILLLDANISQWGIAAKALSNNFVIRDADSTERFTILKTNGNIGIGTTNPITKFHVYEATNGNNWGLFAGNVGATLPSAYTYGVLIGSNYSNGFSESNIVWGNGISSNQYFAIGRGSGSGFYSEQLRIDVNGDVGIGNTNPTTLLSVGSAGSTSAASGITFGGDSTANLYRSAAGTLKTDGRLNIVGDADDSTPDLFFNGAGGFGSAGGQVRAWSPDNTTLSWYWDNTQFTYNNFPVRVVNASSVVRVYFAPSSDSYINNASNFGIGTNAPGTRLDVRFPTNPATDNGAGNNVLRVWTTAGYAADVGGAIGLGGEYSGGLLQSFGQIAGRKSNGISGNNAGYLQFATTNNGGTMSEWMRIDAGGKVGIGTNAPNYNLDVIGSVRASGELISEGNNARISLFRNNGINYFDWSSGQSLYFSTQTSVGGAGRSTLLAVTSGGNVGIGTLTPNGKLHVVSPDSAFAFSVAGATKGVRFNVNSAGTYIQGVDNTLAGSYQSLVLGGSDLYFQTNGLTNAVYIDSSGDVGINTTSPTSKLNVVETTPTGTRIQLGTNSENALMDANKTVDMLILNAPYGTYSATTSNAGAKWGIKFVGSLEAGQINTIGKTSAIYAVSEDATAGYNRGTSLAFYTNQFNDIPYAERMRIYHNGNIGIGITNPSNKLHISGGGISFTTSTGLAVPMIGLTAVNVAYIGPYTTSTDGNAPTLVVFNQGSSVQQTYFYSSGRIAMVLNKEGRLNIAGNAGNTPPALLNVGPASSVDAVSGMSFGNDSSANLYRSAASTIKTDGNINIVGTATLGPTVVNGGTLPSSPTGSTVVGFNYNVNNGNISQVNFVEKRFATGGDWTTATTRIQKRVDVTDQAYIEFNPSGALYGMALGVAAGGSFEAMRILSNGRIGIGTTNPTAKLSLNKGSKDQFLALDIANNDQKYALYVDQDNNGSNSFSVWDATNSHTAIRYLPSSAGYWQLYTNDIERVRIDNNGNVGIGQTNPLSKFVVSAGTVNTTTYTTSEARIADGSLHLMKTVAGGIFESIRAMNMDTTAGTTVRVLAASTSDPFNNGNGGKVFIDAIRTATNMDLAFSLNDVAGAAAVERVRFMGNGNVGIGITNPACKLDVAGTIRSSTNEIYGFGASDNVSLRAASTSNVLGIYTSNVERLRLAANGYFGVGTDNPSTLLSIGRAGSTAATSGITFGADSQANLYRISNARIKTDGNFTIDGQGGGATSLVLNRSSTSSENGMAFNTAGSVDWYFFINDGGTDLQIQRSSEIDSAPRVRFNGSNKDILFNLGGGNIGVGTSIPTGKVHIVSSIVGETILRADGTNGTLFSVVDDLSDSLMSVNNSAGLPVLEVFADDRVVAGQYGSGDFVVANNKVGIGTTNPINKLSVIGAASIGSTSYNIAAPTNGLLVEGNVGIGTTSVGNPLEVYGTSMDPSLTPSAASIFSVNSLGVELAVGRMVTSPFSIWLQGKHATVGGNLTYPIVLNPLGGNVGIGVTNPIGTYGKLSVAGGIRILDDNNGKLEIGRYSSAASDSYIKLGSNSNSLRITNNTDAADIFTILNGGNVGIGTISPNYLTDIQSTSSALTLNLKLNKASTTNDYAEIAFQLWAGAGSGPNTFGGAGNSRAGVVLRALNENGTSAAGAFIIGTFEGGSTNVTLTEKFRLASNGNVGIGTNVTPLKLNVSGSIYMAAGSGSAISWSNDISSQFLKYDSVTDGMVLSSWSHTTFLTQQIERVRITSNGNVGIGTTAPTNKLQVVGQIAIKGDESADNAKMYFQASDNSNRYTVETDLDGNTNNDLLIFRSNTVDNMLVLKGNGNVGIGTTNPAHKLEVFNTANSQTYVRVNNQDTGGSAYAGLDLQSYGGGWQVRVPASTTFVNPLLFSFNEAERARITSDGKVGIGTTNPVATLDIENPASNLPILNLGGGEAGNAVSDLYVLNSYNNNTGVGYAAKVIGVNISGSLTATNIPVQRTVWGGVTSATAIALGTDGPRAGAQDNAFQIWTTNDGVAGTQLTQKFSVSSAGDVGIGIVTPTDKIQISGGGISLTTSTGLAVPMLGMTPLNIAYVGPYNTPTDGNAPSTVLFNHGASVQQTWFYSSGSVAMVLNRQGRLHIGNLNNAPNCLLSVGPSSSTTAVSGMCFGNDAQANLYRSAEDTIKTDGNLSVAGTLTVGGAVSLNGHIYGNKSVTLSTASWTTVLTVNMLEHNSCYVKIGAFGDWSTHSAVAFVSELFIQNGNNGGYGEPGTIITAHDNTRGAAGDKIDIQILDPAAAGTQNFLIQLKLISATSSTNSSIITYHVMGQQASVT